MKPGNILGALRARLRDDLFLRITTAVWMFGFILEMLASAMQERVIVVPVATTMLAKFVAAVLLSILLRNIWLASRKAHPVLRWLILPVAIAATGLVMTFTDLLMLKAAAIAFVPEWRGWALNLSVQRIFSVAILYTWSFALIMALSWATRAASLAADLKIEAYKAQAALLRLQLNPHFLINTMSSIATLVKARRHEPAEEMILGLCNFLHASLASDPTSEVTLDEEIGVVEDYLGLELARFGDRMNLSVEVDEATLTALVPSFILQPLAENAVKHGVYSDFSDVRILIRCYRDGDRLHLMVENEGCASGGTSEPERVRFLDRSHGIGLDNIRQRLALAYGADAALETKRLDAGFRASITLPFREAPVQHPVPNQLSAT